MQTLKEIKESLYEDISNRYLDYLWDEEKYILEHLESYVDISKWSSEKYTKEQAVNIAFQALDGYQMNWNENTIWEAWYTRWYEIALHELKDIFDSSWKFWKEQREMWLVKLLKYLLKN